MAVSFSGPLKVGQRAPTTNNGVLQPSNYGAAVVSQEVTLAPNGTASIIIPAGSCLQELITFLTAAGTQRAVWAARVDLPVTVGLGTANPRVPFGSITTTSGNVNRSVYFNWSFIPQGTANPWNIQPWNTSPYNIILTIDGQTAGNGTPDLSAGVTSIQYTVRNSDGSITNSGTAGGYVND